MTDKEKLEMLIEAIDYSFLNTQGEYDKELTYPVIDKVKFIKKSMQEEFVSEELDKAAESWIYDDNNTHGADYIGVTVAEEAFKAGAKWQRQQMMKDAITGQLENGEDYLRIKCLHTSCRPQDDGKLVRLIIIKEGKQ